MSKDTQILINLIQQVGEDLRTKMCCDEDSFTKLTVAQARLLAVVWTLKKISMADIAKHLNITPASATDLVDRLVSQQWLERISDEQDRRKIYIKITDEKHSDWEKIYNDHLNKMKQYLGVLNDEQKQDFINILQTLVNQDKNE